MDLQNQQIRKIYKTLKILVSLTKYVDFAYIYNLSFTDTYSYYWFIYILCHVLVFNGYREDSCS